MLALTVPALLADGRREEEEVVCLLPAGRVGRREKAAFPQLCPILQVTPVQAAARETGKKYAFSHLPGGNLTAMAVGVLCRWTVCCGVLASASLEAVLCTDFLWESLPHAE